MLSRLWAPRDAPPLRGGWRQRLAQGEGDAANPHVGVSRLAGGLLRDWADGAISATHLRSHMANALADGLNHPMVERLATFGAGAQHAQENLMRLLEETCGLASLQTQLDVSDNVTRRFEIRDKH